MKSFWIGILVLYKKFNKVREFEHREFFLIGSVIFTKSKLSQIEIGKVSSKLVSPWNSFLLPICKFQNFCQKKSNKN